MFCWTRAPPQAFLLVSDHAWRRSTQAYTDGYAGRCVKCWNIRGTHFTKCSNVNAHLLRFIKVRHRAPWQWSIFLYRNILYCNSRSTRFHSSLQWSSSRERQRHILPWAAFSDRFLQLTLTTEHIRYFLDLIWAFLWMYYDFALRSVGNREVHRCPRKADSSIPRVYRAWRIFILISAEAIPFLCHYSEDCDSSVVPGEFRQNMITPILSGIFRQFLEHKLSVWRSKFLPLSTYTD